MLIELTGTNMAIEIDAFGNIICPDILLYKGIKFDSFNIKCLEGEFEGKLWARICAKCVSENNLLYSSSIENADSGSCGVEGCFNEGEYFISFPSKEINFPGNDTANYKVGDCIITNQRALIPNSEGKILGFATDEYPGTKEHFIVCFGDDIGTCTIHVDDMKKATKEINFPGNDTANYKVGDCIITNQRALIPNSEGKILGFATDDYPGTKEHFIVCFGEDIGTCTVHVDDMKKATKF